MEEIKQNIVTLASDKMRRVGIKSISIDDICRELGMSKKTFYVYFETKDDLIRTLLLRHEAEVEAFVESKTKGRAVIDLLLDFMTLAMESKDVRLNPPLHYDLKKYYPQLFNEHVEHIRAMSKRMLIRYLTQGVQEGVFRSDLDVEKTASIVAYLHHEMLNLSPQIAEQYQKEVFSHVMYAVDILMRGIISDEGKQQVEAHIAKRKNKRK